MSPLSCGAIILVCVTFAKPAFSSVPRESLFKTENRQVDQRESMRARVGVEPGVLENTKRR